MLRLLIDATLKSVLIHIFLRNGLATLIIPAYDHYHNENIGGALYLNG